MESHSKYRPRVVIVEYNAVYRPGCEFVVDYDASAMWDGSSNTGASLESFCKLGKKKDINSLDAVLPV